MLVWIDAGSKRPVMMIDAQVIRYPSSMEPESPMNSLAGCQLCRMNPTQMPTIATSIRVAIDAYDGEERAMI